MPYTCVRDIAIDVSCSVSHEFTTLYPAPKQHVPQLRAELAFLRPTPGRHGMRPQLEEARPLRPPIRHLKVELGLLRDTTKAGIYRYAMRIICARRLLGRVKHAHIQLPTDASVPYVAFVLPCPSDVSDANVSLAGHHVVIL